jgi:glycosyltransferase involved in cell wall biosynthesis
MRIAHIVCVFPPYRGGMGQVAYETAKAQSRRGHSVTVFTPLRSRTLRRGASEEPVPLCSDLNHKTSEFSVVRLLPLFSFGNAAFLPQLLWKLRDFDILHLHFPFFGGAEWVCFLKLFSGKKKKLIIRYHMDNVGKGVMRWFFRLYRIFVTPLILRSADAIFVSSSDYIEHSHIKRFYQAHREKFFEIPFGVDTEIFRPQPRSLSLLQKHGIPKGDKVILFVGGLDRAHYFKGLSVLFHALSSLQSYQWKLLVIGQSGDLEPYYHHLAETLAIRERVIFVGSVSHKILPFYYNLCDIFVLPSVDRSEAFGLVFFEAMACGKPVIGTDLPGVRCVIRDGVDGFLAPVKESEKLSEKIEFFLKNGKVAEAFGSSGMKKVLEKYTWKKTAEMIDGVITSV